MKLKLLVKYVKMVMNLIILNNVVKFLVMNFVYKNKIINVLNVQKVMYYKMVLVNYHLLILQEIVHLIMLMVY